MAFRLKIRDFFGKKNNVITSDFIEQEVITQMSYKLLAVHIAASYIANAISKCEIKIFKKENEKIKLQKDVTGYRLNVEPNNNQSGSQFWNKVAMKMLTNKDGALVIVSNEKLYVADSFHVDKKPFLKMSIVQLLLMISLQTKNMLKAKLCIFNWKIRTLMN